MFKYAELIFGKHYVTTVSAHRNETKSWKP